MKKNQLLQLLLLLQLVVVLVLGVSFWERYRGNTSFASSSCPNNACPTQNACSTGSCNTCATCPVLSPVQSYCPTCGPVPTIQGVESFDSQGDIQIAVDRAIRSAMQTLENPYAANSEEIQLVVNRAVDAALQALDYDYGQIANSAEVQTAINGAIGSALQNLEAGYVANNDEIQSAVNRAVDAALQALNYGQIANSAEVQTAINGAIVSALQNLETGYVANNDEIQAAVNRAVESAIQDMENRLVALSSAASAQESRAYAPNTGDAEATPPAEDILAVTSETTDDFDAIANRTSNFRSTENSFATSNDMTFDGSALKFQPESSDDVLAVFRGGAAEDDGVFIFKRFGEDHTILAVNSPPSRAPFYGKEATVALVRGDEPNVEVVDFYNQDYPEAGVRQAGIRVIKEVGPDVTKSEWLPFAIDFAAHDTQTKKTTEFEVLKITPPSPQANVQVNGYLQIDVVNEPGAPPAEDCNAIDEHGRMKIDPREGISLLYICTSDGWVAK